jgi:hypothetical protein
MLGSVLLLSSPSRYSSLPASPLGCAGFAVLQIRHTAGTQTQSLFGTDWKLNWKIRFTRVSSLSSLEMRIERTPMRGGTSPTSGKVSVIWRKRGGLEPDRVKWVSVTSRSALTM